MKKETAHSKIFTEKLEGISKAVFETHKKIIIRNIGNKPGVYALYNKNELYYVGRASDLARRVKAHLKDQHSALWTHFSVYFVRKEQYISDIEVVIISITQPKGNKQLKLQKQTKLEDLIRKAIEEKHQDELRKLGFKRRGKVSLKKDGKRLNLKNYFTQNKPLKASYKQKTYKATLLKSGGIKYKNKIYQSPSGAAKALVREQSPNRTINGWTFWFVKNDENNWVKLSELD